MRNTTTTAAVSLVLGPLFGVASSLAWLADAQEWRGILSFWMVVFLGVGLSGILLRRLSEPAPVAAAVVGLTLAAGLAAGAAYSAETAIVDVFGIDRLNNEGAISSVLLLRLPGLMLPLSILALAWFSLRHRTIDRIPAFLLALGAVAFPVSRIPEIAGIALVSDLLLLAALTPVAIGVLRGERVVTPTPAAAVG